MFPLKNKRLNFALISFLISSPIIFGVFVEVKSHSSYDTPIECLIIQFSACDDCVLKYQDFIKPFYDMYKDNDTITFTIMDASADTVSFIDEMERLGINFNDYGNLPWVVFFWNETQKLVLDADNLGLIAITFENILTDAGYVSNGNNNIPNISLEIINLNTFLVACFLIITASFLIYLAKIYFMNRFKQKFELLRIKRSQFYLFAGLTLISITSLTYQFLDYIQGGCGCASTDLTKILLFREYEVFDFFGINIPFSLLGIALMILVFVQVSLLGIIPLPMEVSYFSARTYFLTEKNGRYWYYFIVFQLFMTIGAFINLLYIELFVIHFICPLCTLSQVITVVNTAIVVTWSPFKTSSKEEISSPL